MAHMACAHGIPLTCYAQHEHFMLPRLAIYLLAPFIISYPSSQFQMRWQCLLAAKFLSNFLAILGPYWLVHFAASSLCFCSRVITATRISSSIEMTGLHLTSIIFELNTSQMLLSTLSHLNSSLKNALHQCFSSS